jgi:serine/threonine protein kinase
MTASGSVAARTSSPDPILNDLIEELTNKLHARESIDLEAYIAAHPAHADSLRRLFPALEVLADLSRSGTASFPPVTADGSPLAGVLGDFRILRPIGRGGMGVVYEAEQISLGRRVALKVLPFAATMDPRQLQRFQNEVRAAAALEHPHIVPVYYVGCERGVHYYAMKFIEGQSLADMIHQQRANSASAMAIPPASGASNRPGTDANADASAPASDIASLLASGVASAPRVQESENLGAFTQPRSPETAVAARTERAPHDPAAFRQIAEWGIQAAEALEHAHSVGIVHRDIKPANLLIEQAPSPLGGEGRGEGAHSPLTTHHSPRLWITDFGLARTAADAGLTMTGDILGTLRYMSPEQALAKHGLVDHRTDIYSLGVTLYELLTGTPAVGGKDRQEILNAVTLDEPRPPRSLDPAIPQDLETIILKAIAKVPAERYSSAQDLANDLRRYLNHEPIRAKKPTRIQRAAKWSRRHPAVLRSAFLVLFLITTGALLSSWLIWLEKQRTGLALKAEAAEHARAEEQRREARKAVDTMYTQVAQKWLNNQPGMEEVQREFLTAALDFYRKFSQEKSSDPEHRFQTAMAYQRVGAILDQRFREHADAAVSLAQAIDILETLCQEFPSEPDYVEQLARTYGLYAWATGQSEEWIRREADLCKKLVADHPKERKYRVQLAKALSNLSNHLEDRRSEAELVCRHAIAALEGAPSETPPSPREIIILAGAYENLSNQLEATARLPEAIEACRKSIEVRLRLAGKNADVPTFSLGMTQWDWMNFGISNASLCRYLRRTGKYEEARPFIQRAIHIHEALVLSFPKSPTFVQYVQEDYLVLGCLELAQGRSEAAMTAYKKALRIAEDMHNQYQEFHARELPKLLLTCPDPRIRDPKRARSILEEITTPRPAGHMKLLALARYRTSNYQGALEAARQGRGDKSIHMPGFVEAMAYWQIGEKEKACQCYEDARLSLEKTQPGDEDLCLERDEAAALLGINESTKAKEGSRQGP